MNQVESMETFVRIVDAGSITKAADQLNTVKSAISRRLSELEHRLGVTLLTRTTRSQILTEAGKKYYQHSIRIIDDIAEVESTIVNEQCALAGRIKIALPLSFGLEHLGPALRRFNALHPEIYFDVDFSDKKVDLVEQGFDLSVRIARLEDSTLKARKLTTFRIILCGSPGYLLTHGTPKVPSELLSGHVKLAYKEEPEHWPFTDENGETSLIKVPSVATANNGNYLCEAAVEGVGLINTPDFICYKAIKTGQLVPILTEYQHNSEVTAYAVYPQNRHLSHRVRHFIDFLVQYFDENPYWRV